jgi:hypothetical protein
MKKWLPCEEITRVLMANTRRTCRRFSRQQQQLRPLLHCNNRPSSSSLISER